MSAQVTPRPPHFRLLLPAVNQHPVDVGHLRAFALLAGTKSLDKGGFGAVFQALWIDTRERVAIKVARLVRGPEASEQLVCEAEVLRSLNKGRRTGHEHIVGFTYASDLDFPRRVPYLVMKFRKHGSLKKVIKDLKKARRHFLPKFAWAIGLQVAKALQYINGCGWIHCDVKPDNILVVRLDEDGRPLHVELADFGVAYQKDDKQYWTAHEGGTLPFRPPERSDDTAVPEDFAIEDAEKGDVYSLGMTIACMVLLTGYPIKSWRPDWKMLRKTIGEDSLSKYKLLEDMVEDAVRDRCSVPSVIEELEKPESAPRVESTVGPSGSPKRKADPSSSQKAPKRMKTSSKK